MEHTKQNIVSLLSAYGWIEIIPVRNPWMLSFIKEESSEIRINVYYSTMTTTVQIKTDNKQFIYKNQSLDDLENVLIELK